VNRQWRPVLGQWVRGRPRGRSGGPVGRHVKLTTFWSASSTAWSKPNR